MINLIGIDPGKITGCALFENSKIQQLISTDFWGAIDLINEHNTATIIIELPQNKHVWHTGATNNAAMHRTGLNVGMALREAELLIKYVANKNRDYIIEQPLGKKDKNEFRAITGWQSVTNQHCRDAAIMAWRYRYQQNKS
jgi:hypothetical protein